MAYELLISCVRGSGRIPGQLTHYAKIPHVGFGTDEGPPNYVRVIVEDADEAWLAELKRSDVVAWHAQTSDEKILNVRFPSLVKRKLRRFRDVPQHGTRCRKADLVTVSDEASPNTVPKPDVSAEQLELFVGLEAMRRGMTVAQLRARR